MSSFPGKHVGGDVYYDVLALCSLRKLRMLDAVNGLVHAVVNVLSVRRNGVVVIPAGESVYGLDAVNLAHPAVFQAFLVGVLGPGAGNDIVGAVVLIPDEVHRNVGKLAASAALEEEDLVIVRNIVQIPEILLCLLGNLHVLLAAVGHLHYGKSLAVVVKHLRLGGSEDLFRHHRRSCRKIKNSSHYKSPKNNLGNYTFIRF